MTKTLPARLADAKARRRTRPEDGDFMRFQHAQDQLVRFAVFGLERGMASGRGTVMFVPGRTEFIEKFYEDMHMFASYSFAVGGLDLRGQGESMREEDDLHRHVVSSFELYIEDLNGLIDELEAIDAPRPYILVGHSAGSHAIYRFLNAYPGRVDKVITVAPMIGINFGKMPKFLPSLLANMMCALGLGASFVPGHGPYMADSTGWRSLLTHDPDRAEDEHYFIREISEGLICGGATFRWVKSALESIKKLQSPGFAEGIETPVLYLLAGQDRIVSNEDSRAFAARLPNARYVEVSGAAHEILKETDPLRAEAWAAISDFLDLEAPAS